MGVFLRKGVDLGVVIDIVKATMFRSRELKEDSSVNPQIQRPASRDKHLALETVLDKDTCSFERE